MSAAEISKIGIATRREVRKKIEAHKQEMQASGKYCFICAICGKKGPKFAEKDKSSGQIIIMSDAPGLDRWPIKVVSAEGKITAQQLPASGFGCMATTFTTVRICPSCSRKNH
ncbi:MAG: hypothetical protein NTX82_01520 [Candidatus Parcubacteria bacterium]|nr:hypothetical protein [Candidatus Parcubacteria bacterium]